MAYSMRQRANRSSSSTELVAADGPPPIVAIHRPGSRWLSAPHLGSDAVATSAVMLPLRSTLSAAWSPVKAASSTQPMRVGQCDARDRPERMDDGGTLRSPANEVASTFPRSRAIVERILQGVPDEEQVLIAGGNTARLYHFDVVP